MAGKYWFNNPRNGIFAERYRDRNGEPVGDTVAWRYRAALGLPAADDGVGKGPESKTGQLIASLTSEEIATKLGEQPS